MPTNWSAGQLRHVDAAHELDIAAERSDGSLRRWTPIWVVCADGQVYVRSWYRRETGWFGDVVHSGRARVRVPRLEEDVAVEDVGEGAAELRQRVDDAYRTKYGESRSASMTGSSAAATTLRLTPLP